MAKKRGSGKLEGKVALITGGDSVFALFITKAALPHLKEGSAIIHTTSVTAYRGSQHLMDYAATKAASDVRASRKKLHPVSCS